MSKKRVLTGVTTTGIPHLGNYVGAIRPAVRAAQNPDTESFLFLADYHGIIKCHEPEMIHQSTQAVAATWLACGLDPERTTFLPSWMGSPCGVIPCLHEISVSHSGVCRLFGHCRFG